MRKSWRKRQGEHSIRSGESSDMMNERQMMKNDDEALFLKAKKTNK